METILVVNASSSSLKFQVFGIGPAQQLKRLIKDLHLKSLILSVRVRAA